ncbi:unnamed protein product, partial [Didymodactylos carnosus]
YITGQDFICMMEDYCDVYRQFSRGLTSYYENWTKRIQHQNTLCSYNTTKRAQLNTIKIAKELATIEDRRIQNIQQVINKYKQIVNDTYISSRIGLHQHRRTKEFKKQFKEAYQILNECKTKLDDFKNELKKAQDELRKADSACEIVFSNFQTTDKVRTRATETQTKRRDNVKKINDQISLFEDKHQQAKKTYRHKAKAIFYECQKEEEHRLDLIKDTLSDFCQAIKIDEQADLDKIYTNLAHHIQTKQNSFDDLMFWAQCYGVIDQINTHDDLSTSITKTSTIKKQLTIVEEPSIIGSPIMTKKSDKKVQEQIYPAIPNDIEEEETTKTKITKKNNKSVNSKQKTAETTESNTANILASV